MGWWSTCIMGGDTPYDVAGDLRDIIYPNQDYDSCPEIGRRLHMPDDWGEDEQAQLRTRLDEYGAEKAADEMSAKWGADRAIIYQVIGLIVMSCGAALTETMCKKVLQACDDDDWRDDEREEHIATLRKDAETYTGEPIQRTQTGLLERMVEELKGGSS